MKRSVLLLAALAAFAAPAAAQAEQASGLELTRVQFQDDDRGRGRGRGRGGEDEGARVSLSEVVRRLRATRQGSMLDAQATSRGGRPIYVIIWEYPGGRIGNIYVDQRTGAVLGED